ncbi:MAG: LytTR family DNA-binding domain-containing protein [Ruegeria sp.]
MMSIDVSLTEADWRALSWKVLVTALVGAGFVLVLEPDHTAELPVLAAFGLWSTHILFIAALFLAGVWMLQHYGLRAPGPVIVSALALPFLFAPVSLLLDYGFGNPDEELEAGASLIAVYVGEFLAVAPVALTVAVVMGFILRRDTTDGQRETVSRDSPSLKSMIDTVPRSLGDDIIRMHAQDHYVEVVTNKGSALLSEQFGACVEKLAQLDGAQCHRSHWIRLAHIDNLMRRGSSYICTMSNGDEVPVSRRRYPDLKERLGR